jgi:hypothetical protein
VNTGRIETGVKSRVQGVVNPECVVGCSGGILAQSIGGGGGFGGTSITNSGDIHTQLVDSPGMAAESIGGGGGDAGYAAAISPGARFSVSVALGASGGKGGSGQDVTVDTVCCGYTGPPDTIKTAGASSDGILAQSVGGGGGNGGFSVAASGAVKGASIAFAMGGKGGAGGNGAPVNLTSNLSAVSVIETARSFRLGRISGSS